MFAERISSQCSKCRHTMYGNITTGGDAPQVSPQYDTMWQVAIDACGTLHKYLHPPDEERVVVCAVCRTECAATIRSTRVIVPGTTRVFIRVRTACSAYVTNGKPTTPFNYAGDELATEEEGSALLTFRRN